MFYLYRFLDNEDNVLYVGKTICHPSDRFKGHCHLPEKCYSSTKKIDIAVCNSKADLHIYEIYYINKWKPIYNSDSKYNDELSIFLPKLSWDTYEENDECCKCLRHATQLFKQEKEQRKNKHYIKEDIEDFLHNNIEKIMLQRKDREELINKVDARNVSRKQLKSIESINKSLIEMGISYKIVKFATSRMINGEKKRFKNAWRIEKITL